MAESVASAHKIKFYRIKFYYIKPSNLFDTRSSVIKIFCYNQPNGTLRQFLNVVLLRDKSYAVDSIKMTSTMSSTLTSNLNSIRHKLFPIQKIMTKFIVRDFSSFWTVDISDNLKLSVMLACAKNKAHLSRFVWWDLYTVKIVKNLNVPWSNEP